MHLDPIKLRRVRAETSAAVALVIGAPVIDTRRSNALAAMRDTLSEIEGMARCEPRGSLWRVREWLERHCVDASDDLFARACALRDRLNEAV